MSGPDGSPVLLADVQAEFPGWACYPSPRLGGGCMAIRTEQPDHPVPEHYTHMEAHGPAELRQRIAAAEAALTRARTRATAISDEPTLAGIEQEFGWTCWQHNGLYYARRPNAPGHDHDAHGDDPADLREAILLAIRMNQDAARQAGAPAAGGQR